MTINEAHLQKSAVKLLAAFLSIILAAWLCLPISYAFGDEPDNQAENTKTAYELAQEIEERQAAYADARAEADAAAEAIAEDQQKIEELEREIPKQQERSAAAAREQYKFQQQSVGIIDMLLSADNFYNFLAELEYMTKISDANMAEINRLSELKAEIASTQDELKESQREANARAEDARVAMEAAQQAQAEVQRRIEEEARAQAEIAAMASTLAEEGRSNDEGPAAAGGATTPDSSEETPAAASTPAPAPAPSTPDMPSGEAAYVAEWAPRIDAYLAGSPLAGQGTTFARAAYQYGVDPRFSPAISFTESSKGLYCFLPHNAWGWGSVSWSSWEEAIFDHVAGLARGYGGQISVEGAKKYCPPNWETWYNRTLGQMQLI